ncbi:MAG TPA: ornithine cyclodeaminase family protein [Xanthobacteraceae bacterium]|jgi:ornithine cyclodeaminase/alanine dehydrogenase-like protein (mu-crystallin family)
MTLILSNDDVAKLLTMRECIDVLEDVYVELREGRGVNRVRSDCLVPSGEAERVYSLKSMDGIIPKLGIGAVRIDSDIVTWPQHGNAMRRVKVPAASNGRYVGLVLLFSSHTGEPLAILPDGVMQRIRVGATNGLGVKYLARENASSVALLGSGWQAGAQLMAVCAVREIRRIRCFSPNAEHCRAFAESMSAELGIAVEPAAQPEDAIAGADIVMCASNSIDSIFHAHWIAPGMHISSIKLPEIEPAAIKRADRLVIHTRDSNPLHAVSKDLAVPERAQSKGWRLGEAIDLEHAPTLADLITGNAPGRGAEREVTCFLNNLGMGYQFAAAGALVYRKARESGLGHDLPTDWFTQDVHP